MPLFQKACLLNGRFEANTGDHVLQHPPLGRVIQNIAGCDGRHARSGGFIRDLAHDGGIIRTKAPRKRAIGPVSKSLFQACEMLAEISVALVRDQHRDQPLAPFLKVFEAQIAFAFACPFFANAQKTAEAAVGGAVCRIDENRREILQVEAAADDQPHARYLWQLHAPARCLPANYDPRSRAHRCQATLPQRKAPLRLTLRAGTRNGL